MLCFLSQRISKNVNRMTTVWGQNQCELNNDRQKVTFKEKTPVPHDVVLVLHGYFQGHIPLKLINNAYIYN